MTNCGMPDFGPTYATMDIGIPETTIEELRSLDIEALKTCRNARQRVLDTYVDSDWFQASIDSARAKVDAIDALIAERLLECDEQTLVRYDTAPDPDVDSSHGAAAETARAAFAAMMRPGGRIVDAGCGFGGNAAAFVKLGFHVFAFDGAPSVAQRAEKLHSIAVANLRLDQFRPQYCDNGYDGVFAHAVLGQVPRAGLAAVMKRLASGLASHGTFYASFPAGTGERRRPNGILESRLDEDEVIRLLVATDLEPVSLWKSIVITEEGAETTLNVIAINRR